MRGGIVKVQVQVLVVGEAREDFPEEIILWLVQIMSYPFREKEEGYFWNRTQTIQKRSEGSITLKNLKQRFLWKNARR